MVATLALAALTITVDCHKLQQGADAWREEILHHRRSLKQSRGQGQGSLIGLASTFSSASKTCAASTQL